VRKKRQQFPKKLRSDIAHAYANGTITVAEIEAKGIRMGNVYKWIKRFVTDPPPEPSTPVVETAKSEPTAAVVDIRTLTKKQLKRGDNGRYDALVRDSVTAALQTMTVPEVAAITKITEATLYLWKTPKPSKKRPPEIPTKTAMVPVNRARPTTDVVPMRRAELLINPATTDDMLMAIRKSEGFANLEKAAKQLKAAFRSGLIDDYDEIDLRMLLGHRQLTGGGLRQRK
jgi:transposase-like protein